MHFIKMHGISNDYIYLDAFTDPALQRRFEGDAGQHLVQAMSHRHTGIGSDGVILVCKPATAAAHVRMRMFNADGSESEMCGNGIRCVVKFAHDRLNVRANPMLVETGRGVLSIAYETVRGRLSIATVDMGEPILELEKIPVDRTRLQPTKFPNEWFLSGPHANDRWVFVSMGNPHAVCYNNEERARPPQLFDPLASVARLYEIHPAFPNRANLHFVALVSRTEATMRTWERGAGITQACGTGACAVLVAGVLTNRLDRQALIHLPGGDLTIRWDEKTNHVFMTGPAADVFEGDWPLP